MLQPSTVYLIDNDIEFRSSLILCLRDKGIEVRTFDSVPDFIEWLDYETISQNNCVLCSLEMPEMTGMDLIKVFAADEADIPTVLMANRGSIIPINSLPKGSVAIIIKRPFTECDLFKALMSALMQAQKVADMEVFKKKLANTAKTRNSEVVKRISALSPRERQILSCVFEGMLNKIIADRLGISVKTVEVHRASMMKKMHAKSVIELVKMTAFAGGVNQQMH